MAAYDGIPSPQRKRFGRSPFTKRALPPLFFGAAFSRALRPFSEIALWLRYKTRCRCSIDGQDKLVQRNRFRVGGAARELQYSYEFQGRQYSGRVVRDFNEEDATAIRDALSRLGVRDANITFVLCWM